MKTFAELIEGCDVALVGNAASIGLHGQDIDAHELVIRINGRLPDCPERCGARTDAYFCGFTLKLSDEWNEHGTLHGLPAFLKSYDMGRRAMLHIDPLDETSDPPPDARASSGIRAAFEAVRGGVGRLAMYGYDGWRTSNRYTNHFGDVDHLYAKAERLRLAVLADKYGVNIVYDFCGGSE